MAKNERNSSKQSRHIKGPEIGVIDNLKVKRKIYIKEKSIPDQSRELNLSSSSSSHYHY